MIETFYFSSCVVLIQNSLVDYTNSTIWATLHTVQNSYLTFENNTLSFSSQIKYNTIFSLVKSDFIFQFNGILNLSMQSANFFIEGSLSGLILNSMTMTNCENLFYLTSSTLNLTNSFFSNIKSADVNDYIAYFESKSQVMMDSTIFESFYSHQSSISIFNALNQVQISNCSFTNFTAIMSSGGVFHIQTSNIIIDSCVFYQNYAKRGGAIFFECDMQSASACNFTLNSNNFIENTAAIDGGAYKFQYIEPYENNNTFLNNSAIYQSDISSFFFRLGIQILLGDQILFSSFDNYTNDLFIMQNVSSDVNVPYQITIYPLDFNNVIIKENLNADLYINVFLNLDFPTSMPEELTNFSFFDNFYCENVNNLGYIGKLSELQNENFSFIIDNFEIVSCPTSLVYMQFSTNLPTVFPESMYHLLNNSRNEIYTNSSYFIYLPIKLDGCQLGEFYLPLMSACYQCPQGYYSDLNDTLICKQCLDNTDCPGGQNFSVNINYWNDPNFKENIYFCNIFAENCLGGTISTCSFGFEGPLCKNCIRFIEGSNYYQDYLGNCMQCPNGFLIFGGYFLFFALWVFCLKSIIQIFDPEKSYSQDKKFAIKVLINLLHLYYFMKD